VITVASSKNLQEIIDFLGLSRGSFTEAQLNTAIRGISVESSKVMPGYLFAALPGARTHGAHFIEDAMGRGAVAILTNPEGAALIETTLPVVSTDHARERMGPLASYFYDNPGASMKVVR